MRIDTEIKLDFSDVLIRPKRSTLTSRQDVDLEREFTFLHSKKNWKGIPLVAANMDTTGTFEMYTALSEHKIITALHKHYSMQELNNFLGTISKPEFVAYSLGIRDADFKKFRKVINDGLGKGFDFICLDVPNGYLGRFEDKVKELRDFAPDHTIIAGNVVTNEMSEQLLLKGADIVKVGIGSGSACLTRQQTGVGYPQLSSIIECADAAHGISEDNCGRMMSDGGVVYNADIAKAFCAGADFVMMGSVFAGHEESGGELVAKNGETYKSYYGMSSTKAMKKHYGKKEKHRSSEGRELLIPYKGSVHETIEDILGSLRSTATYIGARKLKEFSRRATFIRVNNQINTSLSHYRE